MEEGGTAVTEPDRHAPLVFEAGARAAGSFRCSACGYGVSVRRVLPSRCPMCGGGLWEEAARRSARRPSPRPLG